MARNYSELLSRITDDTLRASASACLDLAGEMQARRDRLSTGGRYTDAGLREVLSEELSVNLGPQFRKVQQPVVQALLSLRDRKASLDFAAPDKTDAVAAMERQEIRAYVRGLPIGEREVFALSTKDKRIAEAVLTAPAMLSGLRDDVSDRLRDAWREKLYGPEVADLSQTQETIDEAIAAISVAKSEMARIAGMDASQFDAVMQNEKQGAPWLTRGDGGQVLRVIPGQSTYPIATAEEVATGKFYQNAAEYEADRKA